MSDYFGRVPDRVRNKKQWLGLFFIAVTIFACFGIDRTRFDMTIEGWFEDDDPTKVAFDAFHAEFGSDDGVFIVYRPKDGDLFSAKSLEAVKGIRDDLLDFRQRMEAPENSALNHIVRINTLINAPVLTVKEDSLISSHLVGKTIPTSPQELDRIRRTAKTQKSFPLLYFSKDLKYGGIFIETDFGAIPMDSESLSADDSIDDGEFEDELGMDEPSMELTDEAVEEERVRFKPTDLADYLALIKEIKMVLNKPEYADRLEYYPVGNAPSVEYDVEMLEEMGTMYLAMVIVMVALLWFLFRSISAVIWPISIVALSVVWTIGLTAWLGITVTAFLILTVMLILAVGMADAIHIMSGYLFFRNKGHAHRPALRSAYRKSALACLLTTVTTMIGMLALTFTNIVHIKIFGYMSAAGVGLALLFTLFLLPLMLDLWSPARNKGARKNRLNANVSSLMPDSTDFLQKMLGKVLPVVEKHPLAYVFLFLIIFGFCIYGSTRVKVDTDPLSQYPRDSRIRDNYEIVDREMMGTQNLEIFLDLGSEDAFQDPFVLSIMDELQQKIEKEYSPLVVRTSSLVDVVKDSYQTLNEGREEMYIVPAGRRVLSQTLYLFNNANPEDRRRLVSDDYSKSHISIQLHNTGSYQYTKVFDRMGKDIDEAVSALRQKYPSTTVTVTGLLALMMQGADYLSWTALKSFGLAIAVISIVLLLVFGSARAGLISIIPNLIPATLTFGLLGWFKIPLDFNTLMIAPIIIGIAVDDTIHFITHYRAEMLIDGNIQRALQDTIKEVGQAIVFTTLILGLGFGILAFSTSVGNSNVGKFGSLAVFVALLCDLFLLPAMILIFRPTFQGLRVKQLTASTDP